ncbi:MAG TPA: hypothetical protein VEQ58_04840 [Polyangiaceae bacterium]|nr:hypothetical protein [Polyangiaceae bacterium]
MTSLSPPLQAVVALFRGPLHNVRFADIDSAGLGTLATEVEAAVAEVEAQEAKLVELRQALAQKQEALLGLAQQALAYARIYAEGDDALTAELNDISLPRAAKPRKAPKAAPAGAAADVTSPQAADSAEPKPAEAAGPAEAAPEAEEAEAGESPSKPGRRKVQRRLGRAAAGADTV